MPIDTQSVYFLIGSTLGVASFIVSLIKIWHDYRKEQLGWHSGFIDSSFERIADDKISIKLNFELANRSKRNMSIDGAQIKIIEPHLAQFEMGNSYGPENFEPIFFEEGKSKFVDLTFVCPRPHFLKDVKDVTREDWLNHGLDAEIAIKDNQRNVGRARLFIYEGGRKWLNKIGATPQELSIIFYRRDKSLFDVG